MYTFKAGLIHTHRSSIFSISLRYSLIFLLILLFSAMSSSLYAGSLPAVISSPANLSTLSGSSVTFTWNNSSALGYGLQFGTSVGAGDLETTATLSATTYSYNKTGLPTNGGTVYVRLWTWLSSGWVYNDYSYTAWMAGTPTYTPVPPTPTKTPAPASAAVISSPTNHSVLSGSSVTFTWNNAGALGYGLQYGTSVGSGDLDTTATLSASTFSYNKTGLPTNGSTVYVRLWTWLSTGWVYNDYTYTTATIPIFTPTFTPTPSITPFPTISLPTITINLPGLASGAKPLEMVLIPSGTFIMGSSDTEQDGWYEERPQHQVTITQPFYMGKYEVTQAQWQAVMGYNPSFYYGVGNNYPAHTVSWNDCHTFITALNALGQGTFRLPTEAEWEYACRAGTISRFYWGDDPGYTEVGKYAWYSENNTPNGTKEVGLKLPNPWGLFDMSGNAGEWCEDWYGPYPPSPQTDPAGVSIGSVPVTRGGNWLNSASRSASRGYNAPDGSWSGISLRLVRYSIVPTPTYTPNVTPTPTITPIPTMALPAITINLSSLASGAKPLEMVLLPAGTFTMGSIYNNEHLVTLTKPFYIGKYEVTQAQWQAVMGNNPSSHYGGNLPVECVSWDDCQNFIQKLNMLGQGTFRLPSNAEWEYACRAGTTTRYYWGNDPNNTEIGRYAWYFINAGLKTHEVGTRLSNAWGLFDMSGNVWEWCQDWYGSCNSDPQTDPSGPSSGSERIERGGDIINGAYWCESEVCNYGGPCYSHSTSGFRIVCNSNILTPTSTPSPAVTITPSNTNTPVPSTATPTLTSTKTPLPASAAVISSPTNHCVLSGSSVMFTWNNSSALGYGLQFGSSMGAGDLETTATLSATTYSYNKTGLPTNGSTVYVRLWTWLSTGWVYNDYSYTAWTAATATNTSVPPTATKTPTLLSTPTKTPLPASAAVISSPTNHSVLSGSSVTFTWNNAGALGYGLQFGTSVGAGNLETTATLSASTFSYNKTSLPTNGSIIYVRLWTWLSTGWVYNDYSYTAWIAATSTNTPVPPTSTSTPTNTPVPPTATKTPTLLSTPTKTPVPASAAVISSPTNHCVLSGSSVTFTWNNAGALGYGLQFGSSVGAGDLETTATLSASTFSYNKTSLPTNGSTVNVRLWTWLSTGWVYNDYSYTAWTAATATNTPVPPTATKTPVSSSGAVMSSHPNHSLLSGSSVTFSWNNAGALGYGLQFGTSVGAGDLETTATLSGSTFSYSKTGLPTNGSTVYVRLWTWLSSGWVYNDYSYTAVLSSAAVIGSPENHSTFSGSSATFIWNNMGALGYGLQFGTSVGAGDLETTATLPGTTLSYTKTGLPTNGSTVYVRLWTWLSSGWVYNDYSYTAWTTGLPTNTPTTPTPTKTPVPASAAVISSPTNHCILSGSSVTFTWNNAGALGYGLQFGSSVGAGDLETTATLLASTNSYNKTGLPTNGSTVYVRLWTWLSSGWVYNDYSYTATTNSIATPTFTPSFTSTATVTPTKTPSAAYTPSYTSTNTPAVTFTPTLTSTKTPTPTSTLAVTGSWSRMNPIESVPLSGVWGSSGNDVFAVGVLGTILHYNGTSWSEQSSGTIHDLQYVWGSSASDVFAVGANGTIVHYNGTSWSTQNSGTSNELCGVWGSSASDVFAVGNAGMILHYNGTSWSTHSATNALCGVWGTSGNDVFAVGTSGTILHYNGTDWLAQSSGTTQDILRLWGNSGNDVFAVGYEGTILHYNGTSWSAQNSGTTQDILSVWGNSASDVFAVGGNGVILHYNGTSWSALNSGTTTWLLGVWGNSGSDLFAVDINGSILHYNGTSWLKQINGDLLSGAWGSSDNDVFAVGYNGTILHSNGTTWSGQSSGTTYLLNGVWGSSASDVFVVGENGTIVHYNGTSWSAQSSGTTTWLSGVWGSSGSDVFAVDESGTILHYNGTSWSAQSSGTILYLSGVWGSSGNDVFAVGESGTILHYNGTSWSVQSSGTAQGLSAVWGSSGSDVFAVGESGTIVHYDGTSWSAQSSGTAQNLLGVWGSSGSDVFAVGESGMILHYNGTSWSVQNSGSMQYLSGVWGNSGNDVFAVGESGTILHYGAAAPAPTPTSTSTPTLSPTPAFTPTVTNTPVPPTATNTPAFTPVPPTNTNTPAVTPTVTPAAATNTITVTLANLPADATALTMVLIPAGSFIMGSSDTEQDRNSNEGPQHQVTITKPFYMGKYEVTQAQWKAVIEEAYAAFPSDATVQTLAGMKEPSYFKNGTAIYPNHPVECVSWNNCQNYIYALNLLGKGTYCLPTEAEWEYACRAGTTTRLYWGDDLSYNQIGQYAWYYGNNNPFGTKDAGLKLPNGFGLYDMCGNVWEWNKDLYGLYTSSSQYDPTGPGTGSYCVFRGGCWLGNSSDCRSALRGYNSPGGSDIYLGLRLVATSLSGNSVTPTPTVIPPSPTVVPTSTPTMTPTATPSPVPAAGSAITIALANLPADATALTMVLIPAGSFIMGSTDSEPNRLACEGPQHQVTLTQPFYMGKYEVTQAQWKAVIEEAYAAFPTDATVQTMTGMKEPSKFKNAAAIYPNRPVEQVSWYDCQKFVYALNLLGKGMFRLPTEAEWEYACRAGTSTYFYWGDDLGSSQINNYAWQGGNNSPDGTKDAGLKLPNAFGLYDMSGNVWEWCQDWYGAYSSAAQTDPKGPSFGANRIQRGGSWVGSTGFCRPVYRNFSNLDEANAALGLRLVNLCTPTPTPTSTPTVIPTSTPTMTYTPVPLTATNTPANTSTPTFSPTASPTPTVTPTPSPTPAAGSAITVSLANLPVDATSLTMVYIPAGTFIMGSSDTEQDRNLNEGPQHQVTLTQPFLMGQHEVTQAQWKAVIEEAFAAFPSDATVQALAGIKEPSYYKNGAMIYPNRPVEQVTWNDCQKFVYALNLLGKGTFRLPTEAEWEYACRAGTTTRFYWGDDPDYSQIGQYTWYDCNSPSGTKDAGLKLPNGFGLYDMNGNLWEWCQDWYGSYNSLSQNDPTGANSGSNRVLRGGSWMQYAGFCRSATRNRTNPGNTYYDIGFRVVRLSITTPVPTPTNIPTSTPTPTCSPTPTVTPTATPSPVPAAGSAITVSLANLPVDATSLTMVYIPAGTFIMGSSDTEQDRDSNEGPQHQVTITNPFYMGKYEVTQAQWKAVIEEAYAAFPTDATVQTMAGMKEPSHFKNGTAIYPNHPVECVSWNNCQNYIYALNLLGKGTYRLPTEAEWEYACRAGTTTRFYWGDDTSYTQIGEYAWYNNSSSTTHEIGLMKPNAWGLFDMSGNVWEWCKDWYGEYTSNAQNDPSGVNSGAIRVFRGGSWGTGAGGCRSAYRGGNTPGNSSGSIGFRLYRSYP